ncbi:MAG: hypothetical protein EBR34_09550 [Sphingomonadaceae bacterium]|nr:hypothetical protein [Sphingomonadaceae bacterium]
MIHGALVLLASGAVAASGPAAAPAAPRGVQVAALATVEIIAAARATVEAGPQEPRRQLRRNSAGQAVVEFE